MLQGEKIGIREKGSYFLIWARCLSIVIGLNIV